MLRDFACPYNSGSLPRLVIRSHRLGSDFFWMSVKGTSDESNSETNLAFTHSCFGSFDNRYAGEQDIIWKPKHAQHKNKKIYTMPTFASHKCYANVLSKLFVTRRVASTYV